MSQVDVSKVVGYAVVDAPEDSESVTKILGYAIVETNQPVMKVTKIVGYAVVEEIPLKGGPRQNIIGNSNQRIWVA